MDGTAPPDGTRLILASDLLMDMLASRTDDGRVVRYEWGEPDANGWYSPTFTASEDDVTRDYRDLPRLRAVEEAARAVIDMLGFWPDDQGRPRVSWPVDRDGESEPDTDAIAAALRSALETPR